MDVLSEVLTSLRATGTVYFCDQLPAPWTKSFKDEQRASFHQIRQGQCWAHLPNETVHLSPGDLIFIGPGIPHRLSSHPDGHTPEQVGSPETLLLCGYCSFNRQAQSPLAMVFPDVSVLRAQDLLEHHWLNGVMSQLSHEHMENSPGSAVVVNRLTEVLIVELVRIGFGQSERLPLLRALSDKQVAAALEHLHQDPAQAWTIESLGQQIGLSRAALARRFRELVGEPMFVYLTRLRVERAQALLRDNAEPVGMIASQVGYESEIAFVKVFRKHTGMTPVAWRKRTS
ncbi:MAG: cupin domain-containing protein [Burkholderiaceae bacterium]